MPKIIEEKTIDAGYVCDRCGTLISDGEHDGLGGINWWGITIESQDIKPDDINISRSWNGVLIKIRDKYTARKKWRVCCVCADKIEATIKSLFADKAIR